MNKTTAYIFDFDDTLIFTTAKILVRNKITNNIIKTLFTAEFNNAEYTLKDSEIFDFSEFSNDDIVQNEQPTPIISIFKSLYNAGYECFIVSNRQNPQSIFKFLIGEGIINFPSDRIICTNAANSKYAELPDEKCKLNVLIDLYNDGYRSFHIWEDSELIRTSMELIVEHAYDVNIYFHDIITKDDYIKLTDMKNSEPEFIPGQLHSCKMSFWNVTLYATVENLIEILGECHCPSGDGKTQYNWFFTHKSGDYMCCLYDWKYNYINPYETIKWNIGGPDTMACIRFKQFIEDKLK